MMSLQIFLWFNIAAAGLSIFARFALLSWKGYPRQVSWTRGEDCACIMAHAALAIWAFTLLP